MVMNIPSYKIQPMTMLQRKVTLPNGQISSSRLEKDEEEKEEIEPYLYEPIPYDQHGH